jgi:hypothetical protein
VAPVVGRSVEILGFARDDLREESGVINAQVSLIGGYRWCGGGSRGPSTPLTPVGMTQRKLDVSKTMRRPFPVGEAIRTTLVQRGEFREVRGIGSIPGGDFT